MRPPTIALCIPAFQAEEHLPRLLASANEQSQAFDEIIVCDDASTDGTVDVAQAFGVTVIRNARNVGCSSSKNRALAAATSDWVHFHDADDELLPGFMADVATWTTTANPPDVVILGYEYRDYSTKELLCTGLASDEELRDDPVRYSIRHKLANFGLYKRDALVAAGGFDCDPAVLFNEDVAFHTKLALQGLRFRASQSITSINWRHSTSMSSANQVKCLLAHASVMRKVAAQVGTQYAPEIAERYWQTATGLGAFGEWAAMDAAIVEAERLMRQIPSAASRPFGLLCRTLGPRAAFRVREHAIRLLKPHLRRAG
jgi:hypothetical protein